MSTPDTQVPTGECVVASGASGILVHGVDGGFGCVVTWWYISSSSVVCVCCIHGVWVVCIMCDTQRRVETY